MLVRTPLLRLCVPFSIVLGCAGDGATESGTESGSESGSETTATDDGSATSTAADTSAGGTGVGDCEPTEPGGDGHVLTTHGPFAGVAEGGVVAFLGVPFAAPPTGALRWQPPEDPACVPELRVADTAPPRCTQIDPDSGEATGDEDCLALNLWTPAIGDEGSRPVMVFIHGGGHAVGSASEPVYDGAHLARTYDVVVVTIQYRLGALGYLADDSLDATDARGVSGNYGLLDQIQALRWVSANAAAFGGDPSRVTVFGESAGAVSTCAVLGAPEATGLVHGAIVQSGTCSQRSSAMYRQDVTTPWIAESGCADADDVAACLRAMSATDVITSEPTGLPDVSALGQFWSAYVDSVTLPASTLDQMRTGDDLDVALVVGANAEETARDIPPLDQAAYEASVVATFGAALGALVLAQYPSADYDSPTDAFVAITSDVKFVCGARRAARAAVEGGDAPVFRYHFAYDGYTPGPGADASAFHGLELVYVFGNFEGLFPPPLRYEANDDDVAMAALLGEAWTTFARTGDPSTMDLAWPRYAAEDDPYAGLDVPAVVGAGVRTVQCDFWDSLAGG